MKKKSHTCRKNKLSLQGGNNLEIKFSQLQNNALGNHCLP